MPAVGVGTGMLSRSGGEGVIQGEGGAPPFLLEHRLSISAKVKEIVRMSFPYLRERRSLLAVTGALFLFCEVGGACLLCRSGARFFLVELKEASPFLLRLRYRMRLFWKLGRALSSLANSEVSVIFLRLTCDVPRDKAAPS